MNQIPGKLNKLQKTQRGRSDKRVRDGREIEEGPLGQNKELDVHCDEITKTDLEDLIFWKIS